MKNRIVLSVCTLLTVTLLSCGENKKPASGETKDGQPVAAAVEGTTTQPTSTGSGLHPAEQKLDAFMTAYMNKIKAAFDEQDDQKSIAILRSIYAEMAPQGEALKQEVEEWGNSLSEAEKEAIKKRMEDKPYMTTITELATNPSFYQRLAKSQQLRDAYEEASKGFEKLEVENK